MSREAEILQGLMQRGFPAHIAQGIVANMIAESRLDPGINEIAPLVEGSRGGYGLNQWTGPRRRQFEAYAQSRGVPLDDLNTQLDFTLHELNTTERGAFSALQGAQTAEDAARIYSEKFLRPGIPHLDRRLSEARRLSGQPAGGAGPQNALMAAGGPQTAPQGQQNALAAPQMVDTRQDPRAFMNRNRLAQPGFTELLQNYMPRST